MVLLVEEVRTLRKRDTILYYAHVSHRVYQYMRINSLPSLRSRGAESLVLFLSSSDSRVYVTAVLVICYHVLTRCRICQYDYHVLQVGLLRNIGRCRLTLIKSDA